LCASVEIIKKCFDTIDAWWKHEDCITLLMNHVSTGFHTYIIKKYTTRTKCEMAICHSVKTKLQTVTSKLQKHNKY